MRWCLVLFGLALAYADTYNERLSLVPLGENNLLTRFDFEIEGLPGSQDLFSWGDNTDYIAAGLIPRSISSLVRQHGVVELHLSLVSGRWQHDQWGAHPFHDEAPPGSQAWAWLRDDQDWKSLTQRLAGLFCASLNRLDHTRTIEPQYTFQNPWNLTHTARHGLLPSEHPCTENLTPFISLLPCRNKAGLAQLLNPHKLFDANWQKIAIHIDTAASLSLKLVVETVFDPPRLDRMYAKGAGDRSWNLDSLFGRSVEAKCALASRSDIEFDQSRPTDGILVPENGWIGNGEARQRLDLARALQAGSANVGFRHSPGSIHTRHDPAVTIKRLMSGYGQERGSLGVSIQNPTSQPMPAVWLEELPWWIRLYMHTLSIQVTQDGTTSNVADPYQWFEQLRYEPAEDRVSPSIIEAALLLPPQSALRIMLDFEKGNLRYTEYPPDAHRGFAVPSAILSYQLPDHQNFVQTYSTTSLLSAPLPDFSMPYNVIVLTSTVLALIFGSVFNMLTREFVAVDMNAVVADKT